MDSVERIKELIQELNYHTKLYDEGHPEISDKEWDNLYFELKDLEQKTHLIFNNSPTQKISYQVVNEIGKATHNHKMLSLEKTKDLEEIKNFLNQKTYVAMCKMDGLTCTLTYKDGDLIGAETRGDGIVGSDIFHNALTVPSIPKRIPKEGIVVIDGEIICTKKDFEPFSNEYKNPRNFAAGSICLLDAKECKRRHLTFVAWEALEGFSQPYFHNRLTELRDCGFIVVPHILMGGCETDTLDIPIDFVKRLADYYGYPIDGAVFKFDDIAYGKSLGETSHHLKNAMAYKFYDETYSTKVRYIDWTMGRTGVLTPIAVFEPIEIEGSLVERASLHNLSIFNKSGLRYQGQLIDVFKANQIIPQISVVHPYNEKHASVVRMEIPEVCPYCGKKLSVKKDNDTEFLFCENSTCEGKLINQLDHFCGKKGLDIKGLSKATLGKLMDWGWINKISDLFTLKEHKTEWIQKAGFGEKSVTNILNAIDNTANNCVTANFIAALGIPLIGTTASKALAEYFNYSWANFDKAVKEKFKFYELPNFGIEMNNAIINFNYTEANYIIDNFIHFNEVFPEAKNNLILKDLTFVITGKLNYYKNREAIKETITSLGGKVTDSVSKNTNYLINNDKDSESAKNKKAKSLNIPILSEEDFIKTFSIL